MDNLRGLIIVRTNLGQELIGFFFLLIGKNSFPMSFKEDFLFLC
jgi:hypothetical protein